MRLLNRGCTHQLAVPARWLALALLGGLGIVAGPGLPHLHAAAGDIRVRVLDMAGGNLTGATGARVRLHRVDDTGARPLLTESPDGTGTVVFTRERLQEGVTGASRFAVEAFRKPAQVRSWLYDPFGQENTWITYSPTGSYDFTLPTPTTGSAAPALEWKGPDSLIRYSIDLGTRAAEDFWFVRVVWQKKAPNMGLAGPGFGLIPLIDAAWLQAQAYTLHELNLGPGQVGTLRLTRGGYDETFLTQKETRQLEAGGTEVWYRLFLVNQMWNSDLPGTYDASARQISARFNPASLFSDTNAPAWDGAAMQPDVPYFPVLQAQAWIWHPAGQQGGLAIDWGCGVAPSIFHPVRINDQTIRLAPLGRIGNDFQLRVHGNANLDYTLEFRSDLNPASVWQSLTQTHATVSPFLLTDTNAPASGRFYRVRQP